MKTETGLTPEQKQRILTATGWTVICGRSFENREQMAFCFYKNGKKREREFRSELAAWDSWEPDANWCEETLKAFVRGLPMRERAKFSSMLEEALMSEMLANRWLDLTPELLCTTFDTFILEREGNK